MKRWDHQTSQGRLHAVECRHCSFAGPDISNRQTSNKLEAEFRPIPTEKKVSAFNSEGSYSLDQLTRSRGEVSITGFLCSGSHRDYLGEFSGLRHMGGQTR